jgi:dienelactone hydrolase
MAEVVIFHHAQGLTPGVIAFADELRRAGHTVHAPDLYGGRTFDTLQEGLAYAEQIGFDEVTERGIRAAEAAQRLAQTRPGARGALLFYACLPVSEFGPSWPAGVPVQIHAMESDPEFDNGWDLPAARALVEEAEEGELFLYPGDQHLFADSSLSSYDAGAAALLGQRVLAFLTRIDGAHPA